MAELEDDTQGDLTGTLEESDDVRRIKEEWTRLQMEADGRREQMLEDASTRRSEIQEETNRTKAEFEARKTASVDGHDGKKLPPSRLPSLDSMVDRIPCIPSMEITTGLGKKLPELGSVGHRLGIMGNSKELEPQSVTLAKTTYSFGADTPTQTEIKWTPPANAEVFKSLTYDIEVDGGQGWATLTDSRLPILRVYFTSDKIIVGRYTRSQEEEPVAVRLRVRATGTIKCRSQEETVSSPWSEEIWLSIEGSSITSNTAV